MRLIAFGCSNTFGEGLPDSLNKVKPSKYAWPQILADKLNIECINNGIGGHGPKDVWLDVMNFNFNLDDIVIILWPEPSRVTLFSKKGSIKLRHWNDDELSKLYFKHFFQDWNDSFLDLYIRIHNTIQILNSKAIKNFHFSHFPNPTETKKYTGVADQYKIWYDVCNDIGPIPININFDCIKQAETTKKYHTIGIDKASDNKHPGILTHEEYANEFFYIINNCTKENYG